ncbi:MAG TPA: RNA polymerase sigma-70 factor [Pedobacter sp.]|nr:RNA polymerase sigma-70 factor [Pedobacter sp.]
MIETKHLKEKDVKDLFVKHYAKYVAFASKFVPSEIAEDLIQDVFLQLLSKCGSLSITIALENYVFRAIKNKYLDYVKSQNVHAKYVDRIVQLEIDEIDYFESNSRTSLTLEENEEALLLAVETLPLKCREIVRSKFLLGKKNLQISEEFGISQRTVETHIYKAVKHLKSVLKNVGTLLTIF